MTVTGKDQGAFKGDPDVSEGRLVGIRYRLKGTANNDPLRAKGFAARSHAPISIIKSWGPSSPQFMSAFWSQEELKIHLTFVRPDGKGSEISFHEVDVNGATIASIEHLAGDEAIVPEGFFPEREKIRFRFEEMTIENTPAKTRANFDWKNRR